MDTRHEKELSVLACLFEPAAFELVVSHLNANDFAASEHKFLFLAACKLYEAGQVDGILDPVKLLDVCRENGWAVRWDIIIEAHDTAWMSTTVEYHCRRLLAESRLDRLRKLGEQLRYTEEATDEAIERHLQALEAIRENSMQLPVITAAEAVQEMLANRNNPAQKQGTGFSSMDQTLRGGIRDGQLIVVGGRPGAGKSALMAQFAVHAAQHSRPALMVSLELSAAEFAERLATAHQLDAIERMPLFFTQKVFNLDKITSVARVMVRRHKIRLLLVDYLQLVDAGIDGKASREQQVAHCSRTFKRLAQELKIPVVIGSQLNRDSEKGHKRPTLADLRESGAIEQDADIVFLLSRENKDEPKTLVDLAKHRGGATQVYSMDLIGREFRFQEVDQYAEYATDTGF